MIKLVASHSEKRSKDFNSTGFSASMELEIANTASASEIQERLHKAYSLLRKTIAEEIGQEHQSDPTIAPASTNHRWGNNGGNGDNGRTGNGKSRKTGSATQAQQRAIFAISKAVGMSRSDIADFIQSEFGKSKSDELTVKEASQAIEFLKAQQRAIFAISKAVGMSRSDIADFIQSEFGKSKSDELTVKEASQAIEFLKAQQA